MGTRKWTLTGTATWAKVFEDNRDMKGFEGAYEDHEGGYTINVELEAEEFQKLKESGSMKKGSMGEDGMVVKFLRKHKDRFEWASDAPDVVKEDGSKWDFETDGQINNGSDVEVELSVYDTSRSSIKGTRLEKVKVIKQAVLEGVGGHDEEIPF